MDPLAAELDRMVAEKARVEATREQSREDGFHAEATQELIRLNALAGNADLTWFMQTYLAPLVERERLAALTPEKAAIQGPVAANRHEIAEQMLSMLERKRTEAETVVDGILARRNSR